MRIISIYQLINTYHGYNQIKQNFKILKTKGLLVGIITKTSVKQKI